MGLFDFLRKPKASTPPPKGEGKADEKKLDKKVQGPAKVVADRRAQTYDRFEAIQALAAMRSADAAIALLRRFSFSIDPSITDSEEKELAFRGIVDAGTLDKLPKDEAEREKALAELAERREKIIEAVQEYCESAEQLTWPIKVLRSLLADEEYEGEILALLSGHDTEYARNVEPKINLIHGLEGLRSEQIRAAVEGYLDDVNETVRFTAVELVFDQDAPESLGALLALLLREESVRVKNRVAEGLKKQGWTVPEEQRAEVRRALYDSEDFALDDAGRVVSLR